MTVQTQDQGIQKYARIAKTTLHIGFTVAALAIAATTIYAAAKGVALSSTFLAYLANPWAIAIIASVAAAYLLIGAYQQLFLTEGAKGQDGKDGVNGKDADFSALLGDAIKIAKIVEKEVKEKGSQVKKLYLELSSDNREVLLGKKTCGELYVIFKDENGGYQSKALAYNVENNNVIVKSVGGTEVNDLAAVKKALGVDEKAGLPAVAVSNKSHEALKGDVSPKLQEVAVNAAISEALKK
ncbi:hypothetical protein [Wolbachia pipientis]|uniref:hypothetical protein n=1 Tax=Wolbachia pipientis TaxID=955 RepID=UPI00202E3866|nr:hypothetical protein [Wolbachia pipientis]MCM1002174.1 hypothetical protein [Wolbachia pipientis]